MTTSSANQPSTHASRGGPGQHPRVATACEEPIPSHILARDQLEVEFDVEKRKSRSRMPLVCGGFVFFAVVLGLLAFLSFQPSSRSDDSDYLDSRDHVKIPVLMFGGFLLIAGLLFLVNQSNARAVIVSQECTITPTHVLYSHGGFSQVEKKIPLTKIRNVTISDNGMLNKVSIDTGTYVTVVRSDQQHQLTPEIVLRGVTNPVQVREFIFAKQQALVQMQHQHQVVLPIAQVVETQDQAPLAQDLEVLQLRERVALLENMFSSQQANRQTPTAQYHAMS